MTTRVVQRALFAFSPTISVRGWVRNLKEEAPNESGVDADDIRVPGQARAFFYIHTKGSLLQ